MVILWRTLQFICLQPAFSRVLLPPSVKIQGHSQVPSDVYTGVQIRVVSQVAELCLGFTSCPWKLRIQCAQVNRIWVMWVLRCLSNSCFEDSLAHTAIRVNEIPIKETSGKTRNGQEVLSIDRSAGLVLSLAVVQCCCVSTNGC